MHPTFLVPFPLALMPFLTLYLTWESMWSVGESRHCLEGVTYCLPGLWMSRTLAIPHEATISWNQDVWGRETRGKASFYHRVTCPFASFLSLSSWRVIALYGGPEQMWPLLVGHLGPRKQGNTPTAVGLLGEKEGAVAFPGLEPAVSSHVGALGLAQAAFSPVDSRDPGPARPERIQTLVSGALIWGWVLLLSQCLAGKAELHHNERRRGRKIKLGFTSVVKFSPR